MGYVNGYLDMTSLYTLGTRYDDPTLGRWTQQDPVGGSLADLNAANRYIYAGDDPVNVTDPSGKITVYPEWGLSFFGFPIITGYDIVFSSADLETLQGPGG